MSFLKRVSDLFLGRASKDSGGMYTLRVKCNRCDEILEVRINLYNDLSVEYDPAGGVTGFSCRKILRGNNRCFQPIEVTLKYDSRRRVREKTIRGGQYVDNILKGDTPVQDGNPPKKGKNLK